MLKIFQFFYSDFPYFFYFITIKNSNVKNSLKTNISIKFRRISKNFYRFIIFGICKLKLLNLAEDK